MAHRLLVLLSLAACSMSQEYTTDGGRDGATDAPASDLSPPPPDLGGPPVDMGAPPVDFGIPVPPPGVVICGGATCSTGQVCCLTTLTCVDPSSGTCSAPLVDAGVPDGSTTAPTSCASNADCAATDYCDVYASGPSVARCEAPGVCVPRPAPTDCGVDPRGACGCDGRTYPTTCAANAQGVRVVWQTQCGGVVFPAESSTTACDATHPCGGAGYHCDLASSVCVADDPVTACGAGGSCAPGRTCCEAIGLCLPTDRADLCRTPPGYTILPCRDDADCAIVDASSSPGSAALYYCDAPGGCSTPGGCQTRNGDTCGGVVAQVCGCDGMTYTNACWANHALVRAAHDGACP